MASTSQDLLLLLDGIFIVHLIASARWLPDQVASHFQLNGFADLWISRRKYLTLVAAVGPGLSLPWLVLPFIFRNPPLSVTLAHVAWAGCLLLTFIFAIHCLTIRANRQSDARMSMPLFWSSFVALQIGMAAWALSFPKI